MKKRIKIKKECGNITRKHLWCTPAVSRKGAFFAHGHFSTVRRKICTSLKSTFLLYGNSVSYVYDKIYKHYHYLWTQKKEISMSDFDKWKYHTVGLRDKCKNGDISLQELQQFYDLPFEDALKVIDK